MNPDTSCNVFVFSDSRVMWKSADITASWWGYYQNKDEGPEAVFNGEDFGANQEEGKRCYPGNETPTVYKKGSVNNYVEGMCGYKYQLINGNKDFNNKF